MFSSVRAKDFKRGSEKSEEVIRYGRSENVTPIGLLVAIALVAVAIVATGCLTGDSGSGPSAEAGDSGGGIDPNPAGLLQRWHSQ